MRFSFPINITSQRIINFINLRLSSPDGSNTYRTQRRPTSPVMENPGGRSYRPRSQTSPPPPRRTSPPAGRVPVANRRQRTATWTRPPPMGATPSPPPIPTVPVAAEKTAPGIVACLTKTPLPPSPPTPRRRGSRRLRQRALLPELVGNW